MPIQPPSNTRSVLLLLGGIALVGCLLIVFLVILPSQNQEKAATAVETQQAILDIDFLATFTVAAKENLPEATDTPTPFQAGLRCQVSGESGTNDKGQWIKLKIPAGSNCPTHKIFCDAGKNDPRPPEDTWMILVNGAWCPEDLSSGYQCYRVYE